jgi:glycosyltransferase involved in cell wall biosynthesis
MDTHRLLYVVSEDWYFLSHRLPMARAAKAAGFDVHVATNVTDGAPAIAREGFSVHAVPFSRGRISPLALINTIRALRSVHRKVRPSVVHRVALQPTILDALATIGIPAPSVNAITGLGYTFISRTPKALVLRWLISFILRFLVDRGQNVALVQNPDDRTLLETLGLRHDHIALIPGSGVDVERLHPSPEPEQPVTVGFVGRLLDDKGIRPLIAAHRMLRAKGIVTNLLIAGTPDPANPASVSEDEARLWDKEPGITWLGHVTDIATVWTRAHIAALPSRREGLPKSSLEAASCGRPMIATDVPGCREVVIPEQTGILVPVDDPQALAGAIERLAASADLRARFGAAARQLAVERFASEAIGRDTVNLYLRILQWRA